MNRRPAPRPFGEANSTPPDVSTAGRGTETPVWRAWMQDLGRRQRRIREFLGLSQEQLARLAGVSQGSLSRLETGKGLATPLLIVLKINAALGHELRRVDRTLLSTNLCEALELQAALAPTGSALGFTEMPVTPDDGIEQLVRLYRSASERQRAGVLSVVRAMLGETKDP
jgi:transcriptional regulator with XRE-family HTH domain